MALSNTERRRRNHERHKQVEEEERRKPKGSHWYVRDQFAPFLDESRHWGGFAMPFDLMNIDLPTFMDGPPETKSGFWLDEDEKDPDVAKLFTGLGRAEYSVELLLKAAHALACVVQEFKLNQLGERISEIETASLDNPEVREKALDEIVRLDKMRHELSTQVQTTLPQWRIKGE